MTSCAIVVFAGSPLKRKIDEWQKDKDSLFPRLRRNLATLPSAQRAQAPKVLADAVAAFRDACMRGVGNLTAEYCAHVRFVGGIAVLSYVTSRAGWCEVRDGTKKDIQKWIRQAPTQAERLSRSENLRMLNACGRLAAQKVEWDYVRPKRSEFRPAPCPARVTTIRSQNDPPQP